MEEHQPKTNSSAARAKKPAKPARSTDHRRQRAEELLAAQRERLDHVEVEIESQLDHVARVLADTMGAEIRATRDDLATQSKTLAAQAHDLDQRWEELATREQTLVNLREELVRREGQLTQSQREAADIQRQIIAQQQQAAEQARAQQEELVRQRGEVEAAADQLHQAQLAASRAREQQQLEAEQLEGRRARAADQERRLARHEEELERLREQTKNQRRRIANELKAERASQQHELEGLRRKNEQLQLAHQRTVAQSAAQLEEERRRLDLQSQERQQELAERQRELEAERQLLNSQRETLDAERLKLETQIADWEEARRQGELERQAAAAADAEETARLSQEVERLNSALAEAQASARNSAEQLAAAEQLFAEQHTSAEALRQQAEDAQIAHVILQHDHADLRHAHEQLQAGHAQVLHDFEAIQQSQSQLQQVCDAAERQVAAQASIQAVDAAAPPEWEAQREALIQRLTDAELRLSTVDPQRLDDLQRRFELAVEDVRNLKRRNSELEEQVLAARNSGPRLEPRAVAENSDWAALKAQLLDSLEADASPTAPADRLSIESTILITDEIVGQKDREIAELKLLLAQQSSNLGGVAVGASAVSEMLERDELIVQERQRLRKLQEEWRVKLRQAEIDISVERARVARQRAEIEEKLATYASERARQPAESTAGGDASSSAAKKPVRGRWLSRLGLKDGTD